MSTSALKTELAERFSSHLITVLHDITAVDDTQPPDRFAENYRAFLSVLQKHTVLGVQGMVIEPLLRSIEVREDGVPQISEHLLELPTGLHDIDQDGSDHARLLFLAVKIPQMQKEHGQLYPEELPGILDLCAQASRNLTPEQVAEMLPLMHDAFELAQPGTRLFRGDADYVAHLNGLLESYERDLVDEDRRVYLVEKALRQLTGPPEIKEQARALLAESIEVRIAERDAAQADLEALTNQIEDMQTRRRALL